jgi:hypothetical protein
MSPDFWNWECGRRNSELKNKKEFRIPNSEFPIPFTFGFKNAAIQNNK